MISTKLGVLVLVLTAWIDFASATCPCERPELCQPIRNTTRKEIFIFSLTNSSGVWLKYDWTKVTTVVMVGYISQDLMCYAHKHNVRAVTISNFPKDQLTNATARQLWVARQLKTVQENFLDGTNIDFEDAIDKSEGSVRQGYNSLVAQTYRVFKDASKAYQVTVDVAWSPNCIDDRCYDFATLSLFTDFLFVMAYDERSQIYGECIASANSDFFKTETGVKQYLQLGIPPSHLVLGIPWYGYRYECLSLTQTNKCFIRHVPFRGVNCSDAAGSEVNFRDIYALSRKSKSGRIWSNATRSPFFNYQDPSSKKMYQFWYDDPESLGLKYKLAESLNLRGVGMWNSDCLDNSDSASAAAQRKWMWGALPRYKSVL